MTYYPVCLDLDGRDCIVIGGGPVAERKVQGLLRCAARVTVVSPELTPGLAELATGGAISWLARPYVEGDLAGAFLVIAATDDEAVQERVHAEATERATLLNVADVPKWCNFILPATVRRGDLSVSVSTGGRSPALARLLRRQLEKSIGWEHGLLVEIVGGLRPLVLAAGLSQAENEALFYRLLGDEAELLEWIRNRDTARLEEHFRRQLAGLVAGEWYEAMKLLVNKSGSCSK